MFGDKVCASLGIRNKMGVTGPDQPKVVAQHAEEHPWDSVHFLGQYAVAFARPDRSHKGRVPRDRRPCSVLFGGMVRQFRHFLAC